MSNDIPTLKFDPFEDDKSSESKKAGEITNKEEQVQQPVLDESTLTLEEKKIVNDFVNQIDLSKSNLVLQYGVGAQKKIADFSESALDNVKTKDLGEIGDMLSGVVSELKAFDAEEEKGLFSFLKKSSNKVSALKAKYDKTETNIDKITNALESHQIQLLKDIAMMDKMYDLNVTYFKELSMYIMAGKKKLEKVRNEELPVLKEKATKSNLPEDIQKVNDFVATCNRFEKKIHDLELTRMVSIQMAPQIRLIQSNNSMMVEKIQSTIVNTIPLWKSQMVIALGVEHSGQAAKAHKEVTDMTN
ncbi:MAG TPA: toxic anion resistance protein, partial [Clostridiales bacterium]|nr:toxic anion resistance protein [Clostridiales bacterium]